jgi:DNA-binding PadR family transcriptional regulator
MRKVLPVSNERAGRPGPADPTGVAALADLGRFSEPALLILASLAGGPQHGYGMVEDIARLSGVRLRVTTLYAALARLEQRGYVEALPKVERRRPYRITAAGTMVLRAQLTYMETVAAAGRARLAIT